MQNYIEKALSQDEQIDESYSSSLDRFRNPQKYTPFKTVLSIPTLPPKSDKIEDRIVYYYVPPDPGPPLIPEIHRLYVWNSITNTWHFVIVT